MNKKLIRLTEQDLHKIVKESVSKIINEIGDTPKGQRGLGALHARKVLRNNDLSDDTYNYAQNARGGDKYDNRGNNENPLYHDYANGYIDYLNSHPDEYIANKRKRMSESYLHRIVKESVNRVLNEVGDTKRGQYMLGRLKNRQSNGGGKFARGINYNDAGDYAYKANGNSYSDDYQQGYEDEEKYGRNADSTWDGDKYRRMKFNYDTKQMEDMDNIGKRFIDFIEKHHGGALLQTIVDFETGNETGTPTSPLPTIIPEFEEAVVGHKCTPEMRKAIKAAYNQWWNYAEPMLTDNY
jgi:hypothetical protein